MMFEPPKTFCQQNTSLGWQLVAVGICQSMLAVFVWSLAASVTANADARTLGLPATLAKCEPTMSNVESNAPRTETKFDLGKSQIQLINGTAIEATITSINKDGVIEGADVPAGLKLQEILSLTTSRPTKREESNDVSIFTVGGGRVFVSNPQVANEQVSFRSSSGISKLPLQAARAIVWTSTPMVERALQSPSKENDIVIVSTANGESQVEGILESIDAEFVHINYKSESRKIGLEKVEAVIAADLGLPAPAGSTATVQMIDQSRLAGVIVDVAQGQLALNVADGTTVSLNTSNVATITIVSDRLLYLSDADPIEVQEKAIFAVQRPWQRDRSVENNVLSIFAAGSAQAVEFQKGLGTQASCRLVFANSNEFDRFVAVAGIDAETRGRGDCQMVVRGDGIELWSKRVRGSDGPHEIDVDITNIKQVALLVYPGEGFDLGDHADWCDARFLKTK